MEPHLADAVDLRLWGKANDNDPRVYPLLAHLLDTGAVAEAYLEGPWVSPRHLEHLADLCEIDKADFTRAVASLAALHDIGKLTQQFQSKLRQGPSTARITFTGETLDEVLDGMPRTLTGDDGNTQSLGRHATMSAAAQLRASGAGDFAADVLGGHHGRYDYEWATSSVRDRRHPFGPGCRRLWNQSWNPTAWVQQWEAHQVAVLRVLGPALALHQPGARSGQPDPSRLPVPFITQLVVLADWIASAHLIDLERVGELDDPTIYLESRRHAAQRHLADLFGDGPPDTTNWAFDRLFPALSRQGPRQLQQAVLQLPNGPGITLIAVPMGAGKTEAALIRAFQGSSGLYFALPTGATASAMFDRVCAFISDVTGADEAVVANVLFSGSSLHDFYRNEDDDIEGDDARVVASRWLRGRHKSLLAPVGVGTVDRALHGVFPHKFGFMKLGALSGKTVVLDEVHCYDHYTARLIERLIEWLAVGGADVVLLSATIPTETADRFINAYRRGCAAACGTAAEPVNIAPFTYPTIVHLPAGTHAAPLVDAVSTPTHQLTLSYVDGDTPDVIARSVLEVLNNRAACCSAVIVNTVSCAQTVARLLRDQDIDVDVLHSRMTARQRRQVTTTVTNRFGVTRDRSPHRHQVLVATQVVELSLDIDVDVMVSQLAPIASLLQRSGRLWRHHRRGRAGDRVLYVTRPSTEMDEFPYGTAAVARTWSRVLQDGERASIVVPDEVQELIDIGYDTSDSPTEALGNSIAATEATLLALPSPGDLASVTQLTSGSGGGPSALMTRLGADSVGAILVGEGRYLWAGDLPEDPTPDQQRQLLDCVVPIPSIGLGKRLLSEFTLATPDAWKRSAPALAGLVALAVGDSVRTVLFDDQLGLLVNETLNRHRGS